MRSDLPRLARSLGADERTFRRAVEEGLIRCRRPSPRAVDVPLSERVYLADHWQLLSELRRALRTERNVRLAVLYGSLARGDDAPDSDIDLLVELADDSARASIGLALRLERKLGREVDVARLAQVEPGSPLLLLVALEEGRLIVDRDGVWRRLEAGRAALARRADDSFDQQLAATRAVIAECRSA